MITCWFSRFWGEIPRFRGDRGRVTPLYPDDNTATVLISSEFWLMSSVNPYFRISNLLGAGWIYTCAIGWNFKVKVAINSLWKLLCKSFPRKFKFFAKFWSVTIHARTGQSFRHPSPLYSGVLDTFEEFSANRNLSFQPTNSIFSAKNG